MSHPQELTPIDETEKEIKCMTAVLTETAIPAKKCETLGKKKYTYDPILRSKCQTSKEAWSKWGDQSQEKKKGICLPVPTHMKKGQNFKEEIKCSRIETTNVLSSLTCRKTICQKLVVDGKTVSEKT